MENLSNKDKYGVVAEYFSVPRIIPWQIIPDIQAFDVNGYTITGNKPFVY